MPRVGRDRRLADSPSSEIAVFAADGEGRPDPDRPLEARCVNGLLAIRGRRGGGGGGAKNVSPGYSDERLSGVRAVGGRLGLRPGIRAGSTRMARSSCWDARRTSSSAAVTTSIRW